MNEVTTSIIYNSELDKYKNLILFPTKHQQAVETLLRIPLPNEKPLSPTEKVSILLAEIEQVNKHIEIYTKEENTSKLAIFSAMKDSFVELLQQIMSENFQINFYKKAA